MRSGMSIFIIFLLAAGAAAAAPEIAHVAGPVNHWEPFLVFGEGFDEPESTVIAWAPKEQQEPKDLLPRIISGGLPRPPEAPPDGSVIGLYGRVRKLSPQVLGGVMQGEAAVLWVRSARGTSKPFAVNRPQPFFLEYETAAPGTEIRVFGRNLSRAFSAGPKPRMFLVAPPAARFSRPHAAQSTTTRGTSTISWPTKCVTACRPICPTGPMTCGCTTGPTGRWGSRVRSGWRSGPRRRRKRPSST